MSRRRTSWPEALRAVGQSASEVARAEFSLLSLDYKRWGKRFGVAVALLLTTAMIGFWLVALLMYVAVRLVEQQFGLSPWLAALAVAGVVLLGMILLVATSYGLLRSLDDPIRASKRRYEEHLAWWRDTVTGPGQDKGDDDHEPR